MPINQDADADHQRDLARNGDGAHRFGFELRGCRDGTD
jgi:hypothetical protein